MRSLRKKKTVEASGNDVLVKKQAERIEQLRKENAVLTAKLEEYRQKEREISDAVVFAKQKQDEFLTDLKVRYALENERLRRFCSTMECYKSREELLSAYDRSFSEVKKAREELTRILNEDLGAGASDYLAERRRLGEEVFPTKEKTVRRDLSEVDSLTEEELQELLDQL